MALGACWQQCLEPERRISQKSVPVLISGLRCTNNNLQKAKLPPQQLHTTICSPSPLLLTSTATSADVQGKKGSSSTLLRWKRYSGSLSPAGNAIPASKSNLKGGGRTLRVKGLLLWVACFVQNLDYQGLWVHKRTAKGPHGPGVCSRFEGSVVRIGRVTTFLTLLGFACSPTL